MGSFFFSPFLSPVSHFLFLFLHEVFPVSHTNVKIRPFSCSPLSGKYYTDFDKVKFTIKTKTGKVVSVQADRCGGDVSYATVSDESGAELFRHCMPDEEDEGNVSVLQARYPGAMPYFFSQDPDYITVKERVARLCAVGDEATDIATIDIAIAALEVGEYLTTLMKERLSK